MKRLPEFLLMVAAVILFAIPVRAQTSVADQTPLVNSYIEDAYATRSPAWWNALGRQLTLMLDVPMGQVRSEALQNVIFFASMHGDKVRLRDAVPHLLVIYERHPSEDFRVMAVAALHAIGDSKSMRRMFVQLDQERSKRVKHAIMASIKDHYGDRAYLLSRSY